MNITSMGITNSMNMKKSNSPNFGQVKVSKEDFDNFAEECIKEDININDYVQKHENDKNFDIFYKNDLVFVKANKNNKIPFNLQKEALINERNKNKKSEYQANSTFVSSSNDEDYHVFSNNFFKKDNQNRLYIADKLVEIANAKLKYFEKSEKEPNTKSKTKITI